MRLPAGGSSLSSDIFCDFSPRLGFDRKKISLANEVRKTQNELLKLLTI